MARNQVVTISRMFWLIVLVGRVEAEEHVSMSLRSLRREGGQIWKVRAQRGMSEWLVGWVGIWCGGRFGGLSV